MTLDWLDDGGPRSAPAESERASPRVAALRRALAGAWVLPAAASASSFLVYVATLAPTVSNLDSPELSAAVWSAGVPHPTGYPLFSLLGYAFTHALTPFTDADPAWRMNLLSALTAAAAIGVLAHTGRRLTGRASAGWMAAGLFATAPSFWAQATVAEVYALHVLLVASMLGLWVRWEKSTTADPRTLRLLAFVAGLSLTHHLMAVLVFPALAFGLATRRGWWSPREAGILIAICLAPLAVYAYLPLAAARDPLVNWGNPTTWPAFLHHVTGGQYHYNVAAPSGGVGSSLVGWLQMVGRELAAPLLPLALLGTLMATWRRAGRVPVATVLALTFAAGQAFGLSYGVVDSEPFFLNAHLVVALWIGVGAATLADRAALILPNASRVLGACMWLAPCVTLALHWADANRSSDYRYHDHAVAALSLAPQDAVVVTEGPDGYPPFYASSIEGLRPDVAVVDTYLRIRSSYGPDLDRLRALPSLPIDVPRRLALVDTIAKMDGGERPILLTPGVPDSDWKRFGLKRLRGGVTDALVRTPPDLRADAPDDPLRDAHYEKALSLLAARPDRLAVQAGEPIVVDWRWRVRRKLNEAAPETVVLVLADEQGEAPTGRDELPLLESQHPLGRGVSLSRFEAGTVIGESVSVLVPRSVPPGRWWLWVAVRRGETWLELPDGSLFARAAALDVEPRSRPLWTLSR